VKRVNLTSQDYKIVTVKECVSQGMVVNNLKCERVAVQGETHLSQ